jgi:aspartate aminotransferase-like enzyme
LAPSLVVLYTEDDDIHNGSKFKAASLQITAGVPLRCDETADYKTFRIGLFGIDKLQNIDRTVSNLAEALDKIA